VPWLERVRAQHSRDVATGARFVELPHALARKLPSAARDRPWQWVLPATRTYVDAASGQRRRHHQHETVVERNRFAVARSQRLVPVEGPRRSSMI
jgi:hypothetical protein